MNKTLKSKWLWRYAIEKDDLWKKAIISKHGIDSFGWWLSFEKLA